MNQWGINTLQLVQESDYLDQLQVIYPHEDGERETPNNIEEIRAAFHGRDEASLLNQLLSAGKFPYKDSYVGFLRKDRGAISRNPETVRRICDRIYSMGLDNVISGISQAKEANQRRGFSFRAWAQRTFTAVPVDDFRASERGIVILESSESAAMDFCNIDLRLGVSKRPDFVGKTGRHYVVGEAKFLSSLGGNQDRAFEDGMSLATRAAGIAHKIFILDGVFWIETGCSAHQQIEHSTAAIFSALLLNDFLRALGQQ